MSVEVKKISKLYGTQKALDDVSFTVHSGQVAGLLGPNGAGKSTLMKIITCYLPQSDGEVNVEGFDVNSQSIEVRRRVGYLPEHNPLYLDMYVKEFLAFAGSIQLPRAKVNARVKDLIELTGLGPEQHKQIAALSKGYRQRVGLAQAMIHDPQVLILDEPTTGLDPNQLSGIRNLIREIGKSKTVILSTHIMQEVEAICNRVLIMNKGRLVADEDTQLLQQRMAGEGNYEVEFDQEVSRDVLMIIPGIQKLRKGRDKIWILTAADHHDPRPDILRFAVERGINVNTLRKAEDTLEAVFRQLTSEA